MSALDTPNEEYSNEPIDNTKFRLVGNKTVGYFIAIGMHRLTDHYETKATTLEALRKYQWDIIVNLIATMIEQNEQLKKT